MLGIADRAGEIAPGKAANLVVVDGALFAEKSRVVTTWVDGRPYDARPKRGALAGTYRFDGRKLELRSDTKSGVLEASVTPEGGKAVPATGVVRHGSRVDFETEGIAVGLSPGPAQASVLVEGDVASLELRQGEARSARLGERERRGPGGEDTPDSDVRPLPTRFASPLLAPRAVLVRGATLWTSGPSGIIEKGEPPRHRRKGGRRRAGRRASRQRSPRRGSRSTAPARS